MHNVPAGDDDDLLGQIRRLGATRALHGPLRAVAVVVVITVISSVELEREGCYARKAQAKGARREISHDTRHECG